MIEYLKVGQIINTHGVRGEAKVYPLTDNFKRFSKLKFVYIKYKEEYKKLNIQSVKYVKNFPIIKLEGIDTIEQLQKYRDMYLYVDRENAVNLEEDSYFIADLIGMEVYNLNGDKIGVIQSVFPTGSNDVYDVKAENGKSILIPAIKDIVKNIDVKEGKMIISPIEGLL